MNQPELGKKINEIRNQKGITQKDLSDRCNIDIRTIQRIESGEVFPRSSTIKLITNALELEYNEFNGRDQNSQFTSESFQTLLIVSLVAGIIHLVNWLFYAPLMPHNLIHYSYNWLFSIIDVITTVFFYYGFFSIAKYSTNKLLAFASSFFMIGGPVYLLSTIITGTLNISAGEHSGQLIICILGINCIFFGFGLLKTNSNMPVLYKSTAVLQFFIAPLFILPIGTLNVIGCWLNIPLYILLIIIIYLERKASTANLPQA
jgi:transcriptional regulator with XRE-family HTH domain